MSPDVADAPGEAAGRAAAAVAANTQIRVLIRRMKSP